MTETPRDDKPKTRPQAAYQTALRQPQGGYGVVDLRPSYRPVRHVDRLSGADDRLRLVEDRRGPAHATSRACISTFRRWPNWSRSATAWSSEVRERQRQEEIDWRSVRNQASNENALNEKLRDDRGTNAAALNEAAAEAEARMRANREAYEQGLAEERAIRERRGEGGRRGTSGPQGQGARHGVVFDYRSGAYVALSGGPGLSAARAGAT